MSRRFTPPPAADRARVRELSERRLSPEEFAAWADGPIGETEREETRSLIAWFVRRYPTPAERLAWARRAWAAEQAFIAAATAARDED